jgi:hypothetical protein
MTRRQHVDHLVLGVIVAVIVAFLVILWLGLTGREPLDERTCTGGNDNARIECLNRKIEANTRRQNGNE